MVQASGIPLVADAFTSQELHEEAAKIGLRVASLDDLIESMNEQNFLLKKGGRKYKVRCTYLHQRVSTHAYRWQVEGSMVNSSQR